MMSIKKLSLEQWFLNYQLKSIQKNHVLNPVMVEVDITKLDERWREKRNKPPYTAILIKALAMTAKIHPSINQVLFARPWGDRLVSPPTINVNFPHYITDEGRDYLIASTVVSANEKSITEIHDFIRSSCQKKLSDTIIAKHFKKNRNTFWMRAYLRIIHFIAYSFPSLYLKKNGGGLSVSSMLNHVEEGFRCTAIPWGPTAMTVCSCSVTTENGGNRIMRLGLSWDHCTGEGNEMVASVKTLSKILQGERENSLEELL